MASSATAAGGISMTAVRQRVFCPVSEQLDVCKQVVKRKDSAGVSEVITCGFFSVEAGRCSIGLLAEGLRLINEKADRIASAAEAIYAVMDPEDDEN